MAGARQTGITRFIEHQKVPYPIAKIPVIKILPIRIEVLDKVVDLVIPQLSDT